jgi:ParB-like chromosome segregation protein Spo0J
MNEKLEPLVWHNETRRVSDLVPYPQNPRILTQDQAKHLKASLEQFNLVEVPAINTDNTIVAGHQRVNILSMLGRGNEEIDVRVPNRKLTEEEFQRYLLVSNKVTGDWNWDELLNFPEEMLLDIGFTEDELSGESDDDEEKPKEPKQKWEVKIGDISFVGQLRIVAGDQTNPAEVDAQCADIIERIKKAIPEMKVKSIGSPKNN